MFEPPHHLLTSLASLEEQRQFVIGAKREQYLLPSELLNEAWHFCERVRRPEIWTSLRTSQRTAVALLEQAIEDADVEPYDRSNIADLIEHDSTWSAARRRARETLEAFGIEPPT